MNDCSAISSLYLEVTKKCALEETETLIKVYGATCMNYRSLRLYLLTLCFPEVALPSEEDFQKLIASEKRPVSASTLSSPISERAAKIAGEVEASTRTPISRDERIPFPLVLGDRTRRLLASGMRSLADDLEQDVPEDQE